MQRSFVFGTTALSVLMFAGLALAQPSPLHVLTNDSASAGIGAMVDIHARYTNTSPNPIAGWSFGVSHDVTDLNLINAAAGTTTMTVKAGAPADFVQINDGDQGIVGGYTCGVVICFIGCSALVPGSNYDLMFGSYSTLAAGPTQVCFTDTLGSPPVATVIVVSGQSVTPTQNCGTVTVMAGPTGGFVYIAPTQAASYPLASGAVTFDATMQIDEQVTLQNTQGFSMGLQHNPSQLAATAVNDAGPVAALGGGAGPDFFGPAILANGFTVGVVYDFLGADFLQFANPTNVITVTYNTNAATFAGVAGPTAAPLTWVGTLGMPPVDNVVVVAGQSAPITPMNGVITLTGVAGPVLAQFITGECNGDGDYNLADGIYLINDLFAGGPDSDCPAACDINGDTMLDTSDAVMSFTYLFLSGPAPAAPFPACGTRAGVFESACDFAGCP
ncbi:MAG: hypothetical protein ACKVX7_16985 [Planctomycetota bacterium]